MSDAESSGGYPPGRHPDLAPPAMSVGVLGWLHENLFSSWFNALLTVLTLYILYLAIPPAQLHLSPVERPRVQTQRRSEGMRVDRRGNLAGDRYRTVRAGAVAADPELDPVLRALERLAVEP